MVQLLEWAAELREDGGESPKQTPKYETNPAVIAHMMKVRYGGK